MKTTIKLTVLLAAVLTLAACNPEQIYRRGYSLITKNGKVIRSVHELQPGDIITTHLADGSKDAYVK